MTDRRPNILFLFSDEHSFRFMGHVEETEGGEPAHTPNFDTLAENGTVFTDAYCQMPLCTPSRLCALSGREVRECGAWTNRAVLRDEITTMPDALGAAGYETCLVGKMHLGGTLQFAGFNHRPYGDLTGACGHQWEPLQRSGGRGMRARTEDAGVTEVPESMMQEEVVAQESLAFLREHTHQNPDQPWFLCASFSRPHFPLTAPRRHIDRYWPEGVTPPMVPAAGDAWDHPMSVGMREGFMAGAIDEAEAMRARAAYFACVSYLDEILGDMLLRLEAAGLLENTLICYSTDHGEMAGEHGVWWKNGWYEGCTRVPLIFSTPAQRRGEAPACRVETPVGLGDLFPTFCSLADAEVPGDLDGADLSPSLEGDSQPPERPIFCDALSPRWGEGTEFRSIRWRNYKYVTFRDAPPLMFDLEEDPGEQNDLVRRGAEGEAAEAMGYLEGVAEESIDFEEVERERVERDGDLRQRYALEAPEATGNLYIMPGGRVVNADDPLYNPTVIAENPDEIFEDCEPGAGED